MERGKWESEHNRQTDGADKQTAKGGGNYMVEMGNANWSYEIKEDDASIKSRGKWKRIYKR